MIIETGARKKKSAERLARTMPLRMTQWNISTLFETPGMMQLFNTLKMNPFITDNQ